MAHRSHACASRAAVSSAALATTHVMVPPARRRRRHRRPFSVTNASPRCRAPARTSHRTRHRWKRKARTAVRAHRYPDGTGARATAVPWQSARYRCRHLQPLRRRRWVAGCREARAVDRDGADRCAPTWRAPADAAGRAVPATAPVAARWRGGSHDCRTTRERPPGPDGARRSDAHGDRVPMPHGTRDGAPTMRRARHADASDTSAGTGRIRCATRSRPAHR